MYSTKSNFSGPLLSDKKFFSELINLNLKGLEEIPGLLDKDDYKACRKVFAALIMKKQSVILEVFWMVMAILKSLIKFQTLNIGAVTLTNYIAF